MNYTTKDYAKFFLLMIIPVYGLIFTVLVAFNKELNVEIKCLARGALIARIVFLTVVIIGGIFAFNTLFPAINNFINDAGVIRMLLK